MSTSSDKTGVPRREKRQRTLYYRKAAFQKMLELPYNEETPKDTLEYLLIEALADLKARNESASRLLDYNYTELLETTDGGLSQAVTGCIGYTGIIYRTRDGDRVAASKGGTSQATIVSAQPIDDDNQPVPPASHIIYFAVSENHLVYFADSCNADRRIEEFFSWLICTKTETLSSLYRLKLMATFTEDVRKRIKKHGVRQIRFNSQTEIGVLDGWGSKIRNLFFGGGDNETKIINTTEEQRAALNACEFVLYIKTGGKDRGIKQEALAEYCSELSDEQLNQLSFELGDGTKIAQGEVTKTTKVNIEFEKGVAVPYSARRALSSWLTQIAENDTID